MHDIDHSKRADGALRRSEFYLAEGERLAHVGSWAFNPAGFFDHWSRELFQIYGVDPAKGPPTLEEYLGIVHPQDRQFMARTIERMLAEGLSCDAKKRIIRPDGELRHIRCVGVPVIQSGILKSIVGTAMDITEQELMTQELRRREAFLTEAQRLSHTGSFGWNVSTGELSWSKETFRIFECDDSTKPTLQLVLERVHPQDVPLVQRVMARAADAKDFDFEHRLFMPGGSVKHVHVVAHAVREETGNIEVIGAVMDVTAAKQAGQALQEARAEVARVTRVTTMGELAASIAHEVNQPLAGVVSSANACQNWLAKTPPNLLKAREAIERILRDGNRAGEVLARIRTLLKKAPPTKSRVSVNQILGDALVLVGGALRQDNVEFSVELDSNLPAIMGDSIQLQQVLINLIMNAIEAMAGITSGQKTLRIQSESGHLDGRGAVSVKVSDTGIGLGTTDLARLFEAFYTTKPEGMGLGLWISRSIIDDHGGRLTALSNDGPGATFQVLFPIEAEDAE